MLTAAFKMLVHEWHLAPFPESFLYALIYAVSFLLMQAFGLVLATKQPAMTAAALARIVREATGEDREERIASFFARLASSQLAAAISNVATVGAGAAAFVAGWLFLAGRPWVDPATARETFLVLSPLDSGTIFFAALTGVLLWMGSLAGGWFENWSTYHRLPEGIARHPLARVIGRGADGAPRRQPRAQRFRLGHERGARVPPRLRPRCRTVLRDPVRRPARHALRRDSSPSLPRVSARGGSAGAPSCSASRESA